MSKFKGKLARRIMAVVLSGAMVMSNMSAYAAEPAPEQETEIVSEVEETAAADTAEEESVPDAKDENAETEASAAESSESTAEEAKTDSASTEDATEAKTQDVVETENDSKTEESSADETETASTEDTKTTEIEAEETSTEEESSADVKDEDVKAEPGEYILTSGATQNYFTLTDKTTDDTASSGKLLQLTATETSKPNGRIKLGSVGGDATKNSIKFTVTEGHTAKLEVWAISSDSTINSKIALYSEGSLIGEAQMAYSTGSGTKDGIEYGKTGNPVTVTLSAEGLQGGKTYYIATPEGEEKPANIYYIKVVESSAASTQPPVDVKKPLEHILTSGATQNYFTLTDKTTDDTASSGKLLQLTATETSKPNGRIKLGSVGGDATKNSIKFTVTEGYTAGLEVWAISSDSTINSKIALYSEGSLIGEAQMAYSTGSGTKDGIEYGKTGNPVTVTLSAEGLQSGKTYYLATPAGEEKPANIYYVKVVETDPNGTTVEKADWNTVAIPVIESAVQDADEDGKLKGSVTVTVNADIADGRGEKVGVILCDTDGNALKDSDDKEISVSTGTVDDDKKAAVTFTDKHLKESGTYTFKAVLSRGEGDAVEKHDSKAYAEMTDEEKAKVTVDFKLPLAKPANLAAKNASTEEDPIVELTWDAVKDAESYIVSLMNGTTPLYEYAVVPNEENSTTDETSGVTTIKFTIDKNLQFGKTYTFNVASKKGDGEDAEVSDNATVNCKVEIVENEEGIEWKSIEFTDQYTITNQDGTTTDKTGLAADRIYGDENILKLSVMENMPASKIDPPTTIDGEQYAASIQGATNPKPNAGKIPEAPSAAFKIDAVTNAKIWFVLSEAAKTYHFVQVKVAEDGTETIVEDIKSDTAIPATLKVNLDAGYRYYFYADGSKVKAYSIKYCNDTTRMVPKKINIADGLKAAETYGDEQYVLINVLEDMPASAIDPAKEIEGVAYTASVQGKTNPKPNAGQIPAAPAAAFKMKAVQDTQVTFVTGSAAKTYHLVKVQVGEDGTETIIGDTSDTAIPEGTLSFILDAGYTYYFYGDGTRVKVYDMSYAKYTEVKRIDWNYIADPVITKVALHTDAKEKDEDKGRQIDITVDAVVGTKGGDTLTVEMFDSEGNVVSSGVSKAEKNTHVISIKPGKSDSFTFKATLTRDTDVDAQGNETEYDPKESAETEAFPFILPLDPPAISSVTNLGEGKVEVEWASAKEATGYTVNAYADEDCKELVASKESVKAELNEDGTVKTKAAVNVEIEGFEVGKTYYFTAFSTRGTDRSVLESEPFEKTITAERQNKWSFAAYGSSTSITSKTWKLNTDEKGAPITDADGKVSASEVPKNGFAGDFYKGWVNVWSMGGAGKVVPNTIDGLAFYYTEIDPKTTNFTLKATAHVSEWVLSNGQDGFGLMAADQVGENGNGDYLWTNSYQAVVSKIEYNWDGENVTTDTTKPKIAMKIGVGATEKVGATKEDVDQITAGDIATPKIWSATQTALDTTYAKYAKAGITTTCNMVGNAGAWDKDKKEWAANVPPSEASETYVDFELTLQKNNTGYFLSYKMPNGTVMTQKYYDTEALNHIIEDKVYVGFFSARNANVTFKDIEFTTISPEEDAPAEIQPTTYINLTKTIGSASVTNTSDYDLIFTSNWDGRLEVRDSENKVVGKADVTGSLDTVKAILEDGDNEKDTKAHIELSGLEVGNNVFTLTFTPSRNMKNPPAHTALRSYDAVTLPLTVEYRKYGQDDQNLYAAPDGKSTGTGTKDDPLDIFTAIKYAQPGQTILLAGGTYSLYKTIKIETSVNGKPAENGEDKYKNYIKMIADPESVKENGRPVFDFNEAVTGMTLGGSYWYFKGFDVTRSLDGQKGIQLSGSNNVLDQVNTYKNGNTGLQVSGSGNDTYKYWPQNNLVLNCTSFLNADHGYEDADGFAAKLTIGSGNVFDGCIAAYNADDGWDLFAKLESGQIGSVTIQNCVAYRNGYVLKADDGKGKLDLAGKLVNAGNGNGFKMGGDGLPGGSIHDADFKVDENGNPVYSGHKLINSVSFENKSKGFDSNSCSNNKIRNSISFNNEGSNVALYTYSNVKTTGYVTEGVISYRTKYKTIADEISARNQTVTDYQNDTTYLWSPKEKTAVNASGNKAAADWFESTKFEGTNTIYDDPNHVLLGRNADGTINMAGFLKLTDKAGQNNVGLGGQPSADDTSLKNDKETDGTVSVGDGTIVDDTTSEDLSKEQNIVNSELTTIKNYGLYVKYLEEVEYTGTAVKPEFRVYLNGSLFTDYSVSYKNNINAYAAGDERYKDIPDTKRPTMVLTLKGSYQGTYEYFFDIDPVDITTSVSVSGLSGLADGKTKTVAPTLIYSGRKLSAGKDYVVDGGERRQYDAAGEYDVKIDADAGTSLNFKGVLNTKFILLDPANATDISKTPMKLSTATYDYVGQPITPEPTGYDKETMDISYINNADVGKATITITGKPEKNTVGSKTIPFTIRKTPLKAGVNVNVNVEDKDYTGAAISQGKITVTVTDANGAAVPVKGVKKGSKDVNEKENGLYIYGYTYQYKANTEAGNATLTISGIHNYTGTANFKFRINPVVGTVDVKQAANGKYAFKNKGLEVIYAPEAEYTPNGTQTNIVIKYNGNTVSKKNYNIVYKNNRNAGDPATAMITWKGSLRGTPKTENISYTINPCDFKSGNITAKSVSDVFTNGKPTIKLSELEKSRVALVNVKRPLANKRDYTLTYKYGTDKDGKDLIYDPLNKDQGKEEIDINENTGRTITVYAKPVGTNFKELPANDPGIQVAEFRVAYYNIAQARIQVIDKTTEKTTQIFFADDTEDQKSNLGALNRLNNHTKNANATAPYWLVLTHSKTGELSFGNFENRDDEDQKNDYTYDYENTATTAAGKQSVTLYGTGRFGGTKVFKYNLVQKTYDLKKLVVDTKTVDAPALLADESKKADNDAAIKKALDKKVVINGRELSTEYIDLSYDSSKIQSGKSLSVTLTGATVNGIQVYSGFKTISIKVQ